MANNKGPIVFFCYKSSVLWVDMSTQTTDPPRYDKQLHSS